MIKQHTYDDLQGSDLSGRVTDLIDVVKDQQQNYVPEVIIINPPSPNLPQVHIIIMGAMGLWFCSLLLDAED